MDDRHFRVKPLGWAMPSMLILGVKINVYFPHADSFLAKLGTVEIERYLETQNLHEALPPLG
jgi:hypothetical protein